MTETDDNKLAWVIQIQPELEVQSETASLQESTNLLNLSTDSLINEVDTQTAPLRSDRGSSTSIFGSFAYYRVMNPLTNIQGPMDQFKENQFSACSALAELQLYDPVLQSDNQILNMDSSENSPVWFDAHPLIRNLWATFQGVKEGGISVFTGNFPWFYSTELRLAALTESCHPGLRQPSQ